jgi:hypothetical protein
MLEHKPEPLSMQQQQTKSALIGLVDPNDILHSRELMNERVGHLSNDKCCFQTLQSGTMSGLVDDSLASQKSLRAPCSVRRPFSHSDGQ